MDCWIMRGGWDKRLKGYPVYNENVRSSAERWARGGENPQMIELPDMLSGCGIDGYDDRMNNKVFKVFAPVVINGEVEKLYFDMYAEALVDLLMNGHVEKGIIQSPLTFITRGRMVLHGGELHTEYVEDQQKRLAKSLVKHPTIKDIKVGTAYRKTPGACNVYIYLGKWDGVHWEAEYRSWNNTFNIYKDRNGNLRGDDPFIEERKAKPAYKELAVREDYEKQFPEYSKTPEQLVEFFEFMIKQHGETIKEIEEKLPYAPLTGYYGTKQDLEHRIGTQRKYIDKYNVWVERLKTVTG